MTTASLTRDPIIINEQILVRASIEKTFASLVAQMGRLNETHEGKPMPMILEAFPGGRWYRDLGGEDGHLWAFVQSIKRPALLELWGPLFMSNAASSNLQYRLTEADGGTLITFRHTLLGPPPGDDHARMGQGWAALHARVRAAAETGGE
ncbi:MAG: SRPBCC domain-containing protein [Vicinamibacteraceae bacterium]